MVVYWITREEVMATALCTCIEVVIIIISSSCTTLLGCWSWYSFLCQVIFLPSLSFGLYWRNNFGIIFLRTPLKFLIISFHSPMKWPPSSDDRCEVTSRLRLAPILSKSSYSLIYGTHAQRGVPLCPIQMQPNRAAIFGHSSSKMHLISLCHERLKPSKLTLNSSIQCNKFLSLGPTNII
jgi:hypothetical protein